MKYSTLVLLIALSQVPAYADCITAGKWQVERVDGSYGIMEISPGRDAKNVHLYLSSGGETPNQSEISFSTKSHRCQFKYVDRQTDCEITFKMSPSGILANTVDRKTFSCGFPSGVLADGLYEPMHRKSPSRGS